MLRAFVLLVVKAPNNHQVGTEMLSKVTEFAVDVMDLRIGTGSLIERVREGKGRAVIKMHQ